MRSVPARRRSSTTTACRVRYFYPDPLAGLARSFRLRREIGTLPKHAILHAHSTFNPLNIQVGNAAEARA
jgi:hypothetical protein